MNLAQALRVTRASALALVGAGGKTTALFQLARSLEPPVVVSSSTHLGAWQAGLAGRTITLTRPEDVRRFAGQIEGVTLFSGEPTGDNRLSGLDAGILAALHELASELDFPLLIEADGSRQKPLKAPAAHEPVIPEWVDSVVVVAGLSGLGQPLDEAVVHRAERFAALSGLAAGQAVSAEGLSRVLAHPEGGLKGIPSGARRVALLNQVESADQLAGALRIAGMIREIYDAVAITALSEQKVYRVIEPVGGILLAAGSSSRYGEPKMLLPWRGKPLIRHAAEAALGGGVSPLVVVSGAVDEPLHRALDGLPVTLIHNPDWQAGQSTSLRAGLQHLPPNCGAAVFLQADQPLVTAELVRGIIERHQETLAPIVAPYVGERRATPVLFDRVTFRDLLALQGDTGGRGIFDRYPVEPFGWHDSALVLDIDTPEDYRRLLDLE